MSIEATCSACQKSYRVKDELAGRVAKCSCGAKISIPALPAKIDLDELLAETPLTSDKGLAASASPGTSLSGGIPTARPSTGPQPSTAKTSPSYSGRGLGHLLENTGSRIGQVIIGAGVGAAVVYKVMRRDKDVGNAGSSTQAAMIAGGALIGALAASLLIAADVTKKRKAAGQAVPMPLVLLFGKGWLSIVIWFVLAIFGTLGALLILL